MSKIAVFCVDGVEEIECLTVVDFCRRAGMDVTTVSATGQKQIHGSHGIKFVADKMLEEVNFDEMDGLVYPGGPGTSKLGEVEQLRTLAKEFLKDENKMVAAICAAPGMLSEAGILKGKMATGYPGCMPEGMAEWSHRSTEIDGNFISGKGPGAASLFALEIIGYLEGRQMKYKIMDSTMMPE